MKKRILSLLLVLSLCFGMTAYAFEVDGVDYPTADELNFEYEVFDGGISFSWDAPREIEVPITEYYAYCRESNNSENIIYYDLAPGETACEFTGLQENVEYDAGVNYIYESGYELEAGAYFYAVAPLTAPSVIGSVIEDGKLTISWEQLADQYRVAGYRLIFWSENDSFTIDLDADTTEYSMNISELKKEYYNVYFYAVGYNNQQSETITIEVDNREDIYDSGENEWPFIDVDVTHKSYEAIAFAYISGLMAGTSDNTFEPDTNLSRAMVARILHTMVGNPEAAASNFDDVKRNFWYTQAIDWASGYKIISGNGKGQFMPNDDVTHEQLAVMLYHFARATGLNVTDVEPIDLATSYYDGNTTSSWAKTAVQWACATGVLTDDGYSNLLPIAPATRAEVAEAILAFMMYYA